MNNEIMQNQETVELKNKASMRLFEAEEVAKITTPEQERIASDFLTANRTLLKRVESKLKSYLDPIKLSMARIKEDFNMIIEPLEEAENIVKRGMVKYRSEEDFKKREAARLEAERQAREAIHNIKNEGITDENVQKAQEASLAVNKASEEAPKVVRSESGSVSFRKDWKFEIVDKTEIPLDVLSKILDLAFEKGLYDQVIRQKIKEGVRTMSGVKFWEEDVPVIR